MNIFIVGGTGYLGSVVIEKLIGAGHTVSALTRSEASAARVRENGAEPVPGSLADTEILAASARDADAVVYAASDYASTEESVREELAAVQALVDGAGEAGAGTPVIYTSTGLVYGANATDTDEDAVLPDVSAQPVKVAAERIVLGAAGVTGMSVRAGLIFGRGGTVLLTSLIAGARAHGAAAYIDEGANSWAPIHVDDLADLYVRALERPVAGAYNAVGDVPFTFKELAEAIGDLTGAPAVSIPFAVAEQSMGSAVTTLTSTSSLSAAKARSTFGWTPAAGSLTDDVRYGSYASSGTSAS
ncbi:NAD-dependent epimerase/dehydratase family protein [Glaciihabitans sp. dw_435]|uniref:NAD-dependent epimerase/dehydratase family protein n=1 Tax=Glaciihabitans sp. dw_435 TaxID=2720081 RepID=UPI001BD3BAA5|nr:NAD-dependent epimerase/dehydratase family protein [Glaciihabitans sp. dw_435]